MSVLKGLESSMANAVDCKMTKSPVENKVTRGGRELFLNLGSLLKSVLVNKLRH